jgi:Na+(H+)/acetate symporter ActP
LTYEGKTLPTRWLAHANEISQFRLFPLGSCGVFRCHDLHWNIFCKKSRGVEDYLLGGRKLGAWVTSLSAEASDMSAWFAVRKNASSKELLFVSRMAVLVVSILAIFLAFSPNALILNVVAHAWAGFGACLGPALSFALFFAEPLKREYSAASSPVEFVWQSGKNLHSSTYTKSSRRLFFLLW